MSRHLIVVAGLVALLCACRSASAPTSAASAADETGKRDAETSASPWQQASARGVAFRGIGTEPGWSVEVDQGETPALRADLDYGARKVVVARVQSLSGLLGYAGQAEDGAAVTLHLQRKSCSDGMSDTIYPVTAKLTVAGKTYQGCGRFLAE